MTYEYQVRSPPFSIIYPQFLASYCPSTNFDIKATMNGGSLLGIVQFYK